jgi:hypothetical protein
MFKSRLYLIPFLFLCTYFILFYFLHPVNNGFGGHNVYFIVFAFFFSFFILSYF